MADIISSSILSEQNVDFLCQHFGNITILNDVGEYAVILNILLPCISDKIKLLFKDRDSVVNVDIVFCLKSAASFDSELIKCQIRSHLVENKFQSLLGAISYINDQCIPLATGSCKQSASPLSASRNNVHSSRVTEAEKKSKKKASMKTAIDVINRIRWDEQLQSELDSFSVGYLDRFVGIIEKNFSEFNWEDDIASVDTLHESTLAIPKHRIQYFKYRRQIVWSKANRIDLVFGSTGSKITIIDIIRNYDDTIYESETQELAEDEANKEFDPSDGDSNNEDNDSVVIFKTIGKGPTELKDNRNRPNYFVAFRVQNADVVNFVEKTQKRVINLHPELEECCTPAGALHVTLCMLHLSGPAEVERCSEVMSQLQPQLRALCQPELRVRLHGLDNFDNHVLYAAVEPNQQLLSLHDFLCTSFAAASVTCCNNHSFVPHLTILKLSKSNMRKFQRSRLTSSIFQKFPAFDFGFQLVFKLYLCSILDARAADGFYYSPSSVALNETQ